MSAVQAHGLTLAGFLILSLAYGAYAVYLYRSGLLQARDEPTGTLYFAAVVTTAVWGLLSLVDLWSVKRLTWHLVLLFDQLRYAAWASFLLLLLPGQATLGEGPAARSWRLASVSRLARLGRARLGWVLIALLLLGLATNLGSSLQPEDGPQAARLTAMVQMSWAVLGLLLVEQVFRNQADATRWSAKPLCLGLGGIFAFDIYLYSQALMLGELDLDAVGARSLVHAVAVPLLLVASRRHVRWLSKVKVSNAAAFYSASLLLVGLYLLFVAAAGYYVRYAGGSWGGALQVSLLFAALVVLGMVAASGQMRARLRVFLGKNFFRYRYDYRVEWLRFTAMLASKSTPQEVGQRVVRGLADMVESPGGGLWFKDLGTDQMVQVACWNMPQMPDSEATDSPFSQLMLAREWIFELDSNRARHDDPAAAAVLPAWLAGAPLAWVAVPLIVGDDLIGFVVLSHPRARFELNWEVRDLLKTAARQAAGFLAQMHATEALLEARKFDAFNRMSAFVVHDLKNIITQLSLMLKNAERHRDNPEFQADMLTTVESSLDKMRQMMAQLREGERPTGRTSGVDLQGVVQRIQASARQRGRDVAVRLIDRVATRGHEQRLERVIGHVVQNALDATPEDGRVWVTLQQSAGRALVEVGDTGVGMTPEFIQQRLFRPFNSTKTSGMGIGSYESFQYVKELGGSIDVKSELGHGTVVTLLLPLLDLRTESDLRMPEVT